MRDIRRSVLFIVLTLIAIGVVMIYSSSAIHGYEKLTDSMYFLKKHLAFLVLGFIMMIASFLADLEVIKRLSKPMILVSIVLLVLVLIPGVGKEFGGARRWFSFGRLNFQPSEFAKIAMIIYLAELVSRKEKDIRNLVWGYLPALIVIGMVVGLVMLEPDLGTAIDLAAIGFVIVFLAGASIWHLIATWIVSLPVLYVELFKVSYRRRRLTIFLNPWSDTKGDGFQIIQSLLALSSGGLLGVGLGQSRQKLFYLPEPYSDFIFAIIGEELGFIGASAVIILFILLLWQGIKIVYAAENKFKRLVSVGILVMILLEVVINIGVVSGMLPTKGLPLPFISYGGTSLIFHMAAIGLLLNVTKQSIVYEN